MSLMIGIVAASGAGAAPAFELISTIYPNGSSTVTWSSIPQTYKHLQIRYVISQGSLGGQHMGLRFNAGGNYAMHNMGADTGSSSVGSSVSSYPPGGAMFIDYSSPVYNAITRIAIIDLHNYSNTTTYKTVRRMNGGWNSGGYTNNVSFASGVWLDTAAVNSLSIESYFGDSLYGRFSLYGVKG